MAHRLDHAPELGPVVLDDHVTDPLQPERAQRGPLAGGAADPRLGLGYFQLCHRSAPGQLLPDAAAAAAARARSMAAGATSSIGSPRRAAISSGRLSPLSAATVACTTLSALDEPRDRDSTSCTPAHSSTARTGPPAMTPVPGLAGLRSTTPAAASPVTVCGIVPPMRGTRKKCFLAASTPLAMAAGTSLAFPYPTPTMPLPSPTTTKAVKLNRRPPWTTLATRLMVTTRSRYAVPLSAPPRRSSRRSRRSPPPPPRRGAAITVPLQC